jgi:lambda repressor-like predicted transcriptional regulator
MSYMNDWIAIQAYINSREKQKRNISMENIISKNGQVAYLYSLKVLRKPFPKAESAIAKNPPWAVRYARFVIKKRFLKAEKYICKDPECCYDYYKHVIKTKLPKKMHEAMILLSYEQPSNYFLNKYFEEVLK